MRLFQVDTFTDEPFKGNPAGVCLLDTSCDAEWMQNIAREMNASETAFLQKQNGGYNIRWFTPTVEVSLCGHATLASAHILWETGDEPPDAPIRFSTLSGIISVRKNGRFIEMDFPVRAVEQSQENHSVNDALGCSPVFTGKYKTPDGDFYLLELESFAIVKTLAPDFGKLMKTDAAAVMVTSLMDGGDLDFASRFFAPFAGIPEDPVTGSAHCYLAPYWAAKLGKRDLTGFQASERTGIVGCRLTDEFVVLKGNAVTIFRAEILSCINPAKQLFIAPTIKK